MRWGELVIVAIFALAMTSMVVGVMFTRGLNVTVTTETVADNVLGGHPESMVLHIKHADGLLVCDVGACCGSQAGVKSIDTEERSLICAVGDRRETCVCSNTAKDVVGLPIANHPQNETEPGTE